MEPSGPRLQDLALLLGHGGHTGFLQFTGLPAPCQALPVPSDGELLPTRTERVLSWPEPLRDEAGKEMAADARHREGSEKRTKALHTREGPRFSAPYLPLRDVSKDIPEQRGPETPLPHTERIQRLGTNLSNTRSIANILSESVRTGSLNSPWGK